MRKIFTVWDHKVEAYLDPIVATNKGEVLRMMEDLVSRENHHFNKYSDDFTLFEIGEYDETQGCVHAYDKKVSVCGLWELKKSQPQPNFENLKTVN